MKISPKFGVGQLLFGMKQKDVIALLKQPDRKYSDEDNNVIFLYNAYKLRLTFYEDEDFRLGYLICSSPECTLHDFKIIGRNLQEVKGDLLTKGFTHWIEEDFEPAINYFNEENWIILAAEFDEVVKVELGAIIINDEFDWKYGK